ncbi:MAG: 3' terminal RNA ribose 2'-O-methyltransferase Hen1 [Thermomicrobiales bacterium]
MLLTLSTTYTPATDLGFLLHKNPARAQTFPLSFGQAHVFYPEATETRCTAALVLDIDPIGLVRGRYGSAQQYVSDRPYVASSFLSVALTQIFRSAMAGQSKERPALAATPILLEATLAAVPCRGGAPFLHRLFAPLGYTVVADRYPLDASFPQWGESGYYTIRLSGLVRVAELLTHLYILIPVLDDEKHYWVGDEEVEKLLRHGAGWLAAHPEREVIAQRYLKHRRSLARAALAQLVADDGTDPEGAEERHDTEEAAVERPISLNEQRIGAVVAALKQSGATSVLDLGCGEGQLLRPLLEDRQFTRIVGLDVSHRALERARERLRLDDLPPLQRQRITLLHGALTYRDARLTGYDAAAVVEVIEHLDPPRLAAFARVLFACARPETVVLTTPNREYNVRFDTLPAGQFRHKDHRFEWTRAEFQQWANSVAEIYGYAVRFLPVGPDEPAVGSPTQMGLFSRQNGISDV